MNPAAKRFQKRYGVIADAIARTDIDQEDRERVADAVTAALDVQQDPDFKADLFWHLAADPLVACVGPDGTGCPHGREIRIAMHLKDAPDGRSAAWQRRRPTVRCVTCGSDARRLPVAANWHGGDPDDPCPAG